LKDWAATPVMARQWAAASFQLLIWRWLPTQLWI
jgi:hypothetical protein